MKIMPAIDIKEGKVVRLIQGDASRQTVYSESPLATAEKWASYGVEVLHVVDLDGALEGRPVNIGLVKEIAKKVRAKIEFGGGVRDIETIRDMLASGVDKVVIGTRALDKEFLARAADEFGERIVAAIDARDGYVHANGWLSKTKIKVIDFAKEIKRFGIETVNYTDISRDGTLEGPNIKGIKALLDAVDIDIVASGGVSTIDDIKKLKALEKDGLIGVIIGKAIYEGTVDLKVAIEVASGIC